MIDASFREELARTREKVEDLFNFEGNKVNFEYTEWLKKWVLQFVTKFS